MSRCSIRQAKATNAGGPCKAALDHPTVRQEDKAMLGLGQLDHFQPDAMRLGGVDSLLTRIALVNVGNFHRLSGHLLHRCALVVDLGPVLGIGRRHVEREQMAHGVDGGMHLGAFAPLVPVIPASCATLGVDCRLRLSKIAADVWSGRPAATRSSRRRSWTIASKAPAASQRKAFKTSRKSCRRCGASSRTRVKYGATKAHSSSLTSLG